ncbi:hypothetical protein [Mucilaginibacter celer]|uniref:Carboxypeptidase-like regulatory domain-containing protein n=1 Tax=Mucilaginibacter celer TaxID=2305508 RepID=A0A494VRB0_9SPHI|nr:hypothetical protein [Mucilaginibacter celer]AYL93873.1 hypothetical protein HYN43_000535 [Mucilaginibacter celer]
MKKVLIIFILLGVSMCSVYAQTKTIKGRVISEFFETTPFALIMINDTVKVGKTDLDGFFQVEIPVGVKKISFWYLGFEPAIIALTDKCDEAEVVMIASFTYDFMTPKRVDKLRMKRYKKLPQLHKEALAKGLFKTDTACYTQEFRPFYKKK